jgi:flagellar motor switch protein FliG
MTMLASLTRPQKAAAILVAMGKPSASRLLKFFKQEELKALIEGARLLRTIPQSDLERIVAEFEAEFTEGAGLLDSADRMDTILNESLSPEEMSAIMGDRKFEVAPEGPPPIWPELENWIRPDLAPSLPVNIRRRRPWCCRSWRRKRRRTCC